MIRFLKCWLAGFRAAARLRDISTDPHYLARVAAHDIVYGNPSAYPEFKRAAGVSFDEVTAARCRWRVAVVPDRDKRATGGMLMVLEEMATGRTLGTSIVKNIHELSWVTVAWSNSAEIIYSDYRERV